MDQYPQQTPPNFPPPGFTPSPGSFPQQGQPTYNSPGYFQQPGYPPQMGYPEQPPGYIFPSYPNQPGFIPPGQPPRKSRTGMWVAIILFAVLLIGAGGGAYLLIQAQNSPTTTLQRFCDGLKNYNAPEVYDTLSARVRAQPGSSEASLQAGFDNLKSQGGTINSCTVSSVQQYNTTATAIILFTGFFQGASQSCRSAISLVQENGQWKIDQLAPISQSSCT